MRRATLTAEAKRELQEIWVIIAEDNEPAADRVIDRLYDAFSQLAEYPHFGPAEPDLGQLVRSWPVSRYMVYYRPIESGVEILHIYDGSRDIPRLFR
jgi:toxin ParE1/3/4